MNKKPISQLPDADTLTGNEYIPIVQNGVTKKTKATSYLGQQGPTGPTGPQGISPIITAATPVVLDNGKISLSYSSGLVGSNGSLVLDFQSGYIESEIERNNLEPLRTWNRNLNSVRYSLDSGSLNKSTDVVVVGDSISEGWFGSQTNGTAWPQLFQRLLASSFNTNGRYGYWVPAGTGDGVSVWYTTPRFTPATTTTVATSQISGRQDLYVTSATELVVGGKFIIDSNSATQYTIVSIDAPSGYVTVNALLPALTAGVSRICVLGTEKISRGFSLRAMDMPRGSRVSTTVTGTSVDIFFRYVNAFAQSGIRFSVTDSVDATVVFPVTKLSATIAPGDVFLGLADLATTVGITVGSVIQIDNEQMLVDSVVDYGLGVTRGYNSTVSASHSSQATVSATTAQFFTFRNSGTSYCQASGGQELAVEKILFPSRGTYTLLVEQLTMNLSGNPDTSGSFNGASTFDGVWVHDGTEEQGVRVWNSSRFGSTYSNWNNTEKYQITTLAAALTANVNQTSVSLVADAASVGVTVGSTLFVLNDVAYGYLTYEQMTVTGISGSTVTVLRAQNGTAVASHTSGYQVQLPYTSPTMSSANTGWLSAVRQGLVKPSLYVIALGTNDQGVADLTIDSRMRIMVATIKACHSAGGLSQPSFVFMIPPYRDPIGSLTKEQWDLTLAKMYNTANDLNAAVWDWAELTGPIAVSTTTVNTLASSMTSSQTTLTLTSSPGTSITVGTVITVRAGAGNILSVYEKMIVRSISGSVLTVKRGHNGSSATSHDAGQSVGLGDPDYWSADGVHPVAQGQLAIGNFATSKALYSLPLNPQTEGRVVNTTKGDITLGSIGNTDYVYIVTGQHLITLPTAISNTSKYIIKNKHTSNITIQSTSAQTIDGTTTISLAPNESIDLISDNSNWSII